MLISFISARKRSRHVCLRLQAYSKSEKLTDSPGGYYWELMERNSAPTVVSAPSTRFLCYSKRYSKYILKQKILHKINELGTQFNSPRHIDDQAPQTFH
ncbi:protein of unknown function [Pseudomonas sp. JV241A]|nr:protein of unknown function [Pseudomonas sp. JV241A]